MFDSTADEMNGSAKATYTQILVASSVGLIIAAALHYRIRKVRDRKIIPRKRISAADQVLSIEKFSHYVGNKKSLPLPLLPCIFDCVCCDQDHQY